MANCNKLFKSYEEEISLTSGKRDRLKQSKDGLRKRIRRYFKENHPEYEPKFYIQGSYKMKSTIRTKDDICDVDDGVYFFRKPDVTSTTLQTWVWNAVNGYTDTEPQHRKKCIRSVFTSDYEIDMPVYYKVDNEEYQIAIKNDGWRDDDPKAMIEWFNEKKDKDGVLIALTKYLKAWCDNRRNSMPSGLAMTILASNVKDKIVYDKDRMDITLRDTLKEIKKALDLSFECKVPVTPKDNLFEEYDSQRKQNFLDALKEFIEDADSAIREPNEKKASKLWRKHLGSRFPEGEDQEENKAGNNSRLIAGIGSSSPWAK